MTTEENDLHVQKLTTARARLQFTLWTLMLVATLICIGLAAFRIIGVWILTYTPLALLPPVLYFYNRNEVFARTADALWLPVMLLWLFICTVFVWT